MEAVSKEVIECNKQFYQTINSNKRIIVHQGGSRSGKTYAICKYIIYLLTTRKKKLIITVARKTLPALKGSVYRDFMEIAERVGCSTTDISNYISENRFPNSSRMIKLANVLKVRVTDIYPTAKRKFYFELQD